jgi:hypothetical protein
MSSLDKLIPVLDGTNWCEWEVCMTAYLQMQELWEVVSENTKPIEPEQPEDEESTEHAMALAVYNAAYTIWKKENSKASGIITLHMAAHLRHNISDSAHATWTMLKATFSAPTVSALYADFKQILATKLSGNRIIPKIEHLATLFERLNATSLRLSENLQAMILLAALPPKWDSVTQMFFQHANLAAVLMFPNVRKAIVFEYKRHGRPTDQSANKLSAVKRKGPDPAHCQHQQQRTPEPQPGPSQQQQPFQQGKMKRRGGRQEKERQERCTAKQKQHNHGYFTWPAQTVEVVEPIMAPTFINASQPSRAAPVHSSIASFGKNGIEYHKQPLRNRRPQRVYGRCSTEHETSVTRSRSLRLPKTSSPSKRQS